ILACAIIIASVGLNVNSIPVIIGAMLISPVMGPILGFAFGLGTNDINLVKESLKNYLVMVLISILASTLFFVLSPLKLENPTELLARTRPSIYDVLIALFGGLAGILETCRKDKGTVISGVAIATALMPPLCTVGYGISILKLSYILGALYLFLINSIFIALATFAAVKYLRFPSAEGAGTSKQMPSRAVAAIPVLIIVPSIYSAVLMVKENNFNIHAEKIVSANKAIGRGFIYDYNTDLKSNPPVLNLFMAGEALSDQAKEQIYKEAEIYGITRGQIQFHEDASMQGEMMSQSELVTAIYERSDRQITALSDSIASLKSSLNYYQDKELPTETLSKELFAQYPAITNLILTRGASVDSQTGNSSDKIVAILTSKSRLDKESLGRIERWLKIRLNTDSITVMEQVAE
ncbi:MAG: DUF389 domain-containing protein, partial [Bacteroidales bacterium]|nr:DUF389 domain-containing protein [Bacteroidales bacterium]